MRKTVTVVAACALATGIASAQMKPKPSAPPPSSPVRVTGPGNTQATTAQVQNFTRVSTADAYRRQQNGSAVIVDVRSNTQFALGHIKGAYNIPNSQLMSRLRELPAGKQIITYCACSAEQSSGHAVMQLQAHGVKTAVAMKGGWNQWKAEGLPIATGPK